MVALLTSNSPKHAGVADRCREIAASAQLTTDAMLHLVDEDARSFDRVSAAYRLPKTQDSEKTARTASIQTALAGAIEPPMRVIALARETCDLALELADIGNPNALSDIGCAALCAQAAAHGAALNVEINAGALRDRSQAQRYTEQLHAAIAQVSLLAEVILGKLHAKSEA
jgi:glutamate formiminotransferase/formiminotetrahydrofolate cyclodeaminase